MTAKVEPSAEALEVARGLCDHGHCEAYNYCWTCSTADGQGCSYCARLALALDAFAAEAAAGMLHRVRGSLESYPHTGGDIGVMQQVERIAAEARRQENETCQEIAETFHAGAGCLFNSDHALAVQHFTRSIIEAIAARREPKP